MKCFHFEIVFIFVNLKLLFRMGIFFFIPKFQVFKSLTKISVYDILTNNFKVNPSQKLKLQYRVPMKKYFEEINFYYDILDVNQNSSVIRYNNWTHYFILFHLLFNALKLLFHILWNEKDQLIRLYGGNLELFFGSNTLYFSIPEAGATLYCIATFYLFQYSPISQLNWLKLFDPIEGKDTFAKSKIFMAKSAKNLIRFSLILIVYFSFFNHITPIYASFFFIFIPLKYLTFTQFILYALPWGLIDTIWVLFGSYYFLGGLIITIISYYYELRLNQLDVYLNVYLKRKRFKRINQQIDKILVEYVDVINEMNQLNKFVSKLVFFLLFCCSSTLAFLIYNMIYVKIEWIVYILYILFSGQMSLVILIIVLTTIRIASKFHRNKRNLMKLIYVKNLQIKNKFKVSSCVLIIIK